MWDLAELAWPWRRQAVYRPDQRLDRQGVNGTWRNSKADEPLPGAPGPRGRWQNERRDPRGSGEPPASGRRFDQRPRTKATPTQTIDRSAGARVIHASLSLLPPASLYHLGYASSAAGAVAQPWESRRTLKGPRRLTGLGRSNSSRRAFSPVSLCGITSCFKMGSHPQCL